ncbi:MAG: hypothetical protein ACRDQ7_08335 [Haloechinothrix sp.]
MSQGFAMLHGDTVYRIYWKLGTDVLIGVCHCWAEHESDDPVELWDWLLAHPEGHRSPRDDGEALSPTSRQPVGSSSY